MKAVETWGTYRNFRTLIAYHTTECADGISWYCAYVRVPFVMVRNVSMMKFDRPLTYGTWLEQDEHPWKMCWPSGKPAEDGFAVMGWDYNTEEERSVTTMQHVKGDIEDFVDRVIEMIKRDVV